MFDSFTRIASLVLAFGLFISCSTLSLQKKDTTKNPDELSENLIRQRLDSLDKQIDQGTQDPALFYQKALLLTELAQKKAPPSDRTPIYSKVHDTFKKASDLFADSAGSKTEKIRQLIKISWSNEHNQGVQIMQTDSTLSSSDYQKAADYFKNATIIIPDSSISYKMEAKAYYKNHKEEKAISVLEGARNHIQDMPTPLLAQLAFLYSDTQQPLKAIEVYKQMDPAKGQNLNIIHGLINAYIAAGEHQNALNLLQSLIAKEPDNIIYQQTLASELFTVASQQLNSVASSLQKGTKLSNTKFQNADSLIGKAEQQFKKLSKENPEDLDIMQQFATFYQNSASEYQRILPLVNQEEKLQIERQITNYLTSSIPLLKELTKQHPDNKNTWKNLYQAYSYLGMKEEAQNAKSHF